MILVVVVMNVLGGSVAGSDFVIVTGGTVLVLIIGEHRVTVSVRG